MSASISAEQEQSAVRISEEVEVYYYKQEAGCSRTPIPHEEIPPHAVVKIERQAREVAASLPEYPNVAWLAHYFRDPDPESKFQPGNFVSYIITGKQEDSESSL